MKARRLMYDVDWMLMRQGNPMHQKLLLVLILIFVLVGTNADEDDIIGPDNYPENINPLTGLPVEDPAVLNRRPVIAKIVNAPAEVRPQYGLMQADIVWEHLLAGGWTRFSAVYLSQEPDFIGPIRSARLIDFELIRIYRGLLTYSGMAEGTIQVMRNDPLVVSRMVGGDGPCPALCRDFSLNEKLEYTLFGNVAELRKLAEAIGRDTTPEPINSMAFSQSPPANGIPLDRINIEYRQTDIDWIWDETSGVWLREQDGMVHRTAETGDQITAVNILIMEEEHTEQPFVSEGFWGPSNFAFSVNFIGSGRAVLLRDGQYFEGVWRRERQDGTLTFFDLAGDPLPFKPGNTFFNLVPRWIESYQLTFGLPNPPTATVSASSINLRWGPGTGYSPGGAAYRGDTLTLIGRNNSSTWYQVAFTDPILGEGKTLWAWAEALSFSDEALTLPLARPTIED